MSRNSYFSLHAPNLNLVVNKSLIRTKSRSSQLLLELNEWSGISACCRLKFWGVFQLICWIRKCSIRTLLCRAFHADFFLSSDKKLSRVLCVFLFVLGCTMVALLVTALPALWKLRFGSGQDLLEIGFEPALELEFWYETGRQYYGAVWPKFWKSSFCRIIIWFGQLILIKNCKAFCWV